MDDHRIPVPSIHTVKNTFNITKTRNNRLTKTKKMLKLQKKKYTNQKCNDVAFRKHGVPQETRRTVNPLRGKTEFPANKLLR